SVADVPPAPSPGSPHATVAVIVVRETHAAKEGKPISEEPVMESVEGKSVADKAVPGKAIADKAVPGKAIADKAVPGETIAGKSVACETGADHAASTHAAEVCAAKAASSK